MDTYRARKDVEKYARVVPTSEIAGNDFNLNIPRYVDTAEASEAIDLSTVQTEIDALESQWQEQRQKMAQYLQELGL